MKVKANFTLERAVKTQRGKRSVAVPFDMSPFSLLLDRRTPMQLRNVQGDWLGPWTRLGGCPISMEISIKYVWKL